MRRVDWPARRIDRVLQLVLINRHEAGEVSVCREFCTERFAHYKLSIALVPRAQQDLRAPQASGREDHLLGRGMILVVVIEPGVMHRVTARDRLDGFHIGKRRMRTLSCAAKGSWFSN